jgi:acyl-CoA thioester hydrolase
MAKSDYKFFFPFRVRYSETDAQGIVFNAHYFTYFDTAIYEYFRDLPYDLLDHVKNTGTDFHVVRVAIDFLAPTRFDDEIEAHIRVHRVGRSSITFLVKIFSKDSEKPLVKGEVVWVNTDQKTQKSAPVPKKLLAIIKAKEGIDFKPH